MPFTNQNNSSPFLFSEKVSPFGFNGKENDAETSTQDYGMRIYNPGLGRFLSVDPLTQKLAMLTPYAFANSSPILYVDADGAWHVTYYQITDKSGHTVTITVRDNSYVHYAVIRNVIDIGFGAEYDPLVYYTWTGYNRVDYVKVDYSKMKNGQPTTTKSGYEIEQTWEEGITAYAQTGGTIIADLGDGKPTDISLLVSVLGGAETTSQPGAPESVTALFKSIIDLLNKWATINDDFTLLREEYDKAAANPEKQAKNPDTVCSTCGVSANHGLGTTVIDRKTGDTVTKLDANGKEIKTTVKAKVTPAAKTAPR